jgi:6,7-dimethyl-8-ribityllumazine synthase
MQQAKQGSFEPFDASAWQMGMVVAQFNKNITDQLKKSALDRANDYNVSTKNLIVLDVAGAVEIPLILQKLARTGKYKALLAIGCVIQGTTPHFDYVCKFVTDGILRVQLDTHTPIGFGVLTCNNEAEALARVDLGSNHFDAVMHQALILEKLVKS